MRCEPGDTLPFDHVRARATRAAALSKVGSMSDLLAGGLAGENLMASFASGLGLTYVGTPNRIYREQVPTEIPWTELPLLQQAEPEHLIDLMYGIFGGHNVQGFNLDLMTYREESSMPKRSCVLFHLDDVSFPTLTVSPHSRLSLAQERDRSPFAQKYRILGRDPEVAKLVLDDSMRSWLMGLTIPLRLELGGGEVLGHVPKADAADWPLLIQTVYGFVIRIPDAATFRYV